MPSLVIASTAHASDIYINVQSDDPHTGYLSTFNLCSDGGNLDSYTHWFTSSWITNNHPGEVFIGWQIDGTGTLFPDQSPCSNFPDRSNIFAQWTPAPPAVTFESNGGTGSMSIQASSVTANLSANTFMRAGYDFAGWNTAADGTGTAYANGATYDFSADLTLYAQWTLLPGTHTVTFDANGGEGSMDPQSSSGSQTLSLNTFTRSGYEFTGWDDTANTYADGATYDFSADKTLYAQWTLLPGTHTVTFDANGGTGSMSNQTSSVSANLSPNIFTHGDFVFTGWNTDPNGNGDAYVDAASYSFSSDVTLYAQWESGSTVTFDPNGGSGSIMASQTAHGSVGLTSNTYSRDGYDFLGWNTTADGTGDPYADGGTYNFQSFSLANAHLYAQWRLRSSGTKGTVVLVKDPIASFGATTPAFTITMPQATLSSNVKFLDFGAFANGTYWRPLTDNSHCRSSNFARPDNVSTCGILGITINGTDTTHSWRAYQLPGVQGVRLQWTGADMPTSTSDIVVSFTSGAFTLANVNANYLLSLTTRSFDGIIEVASTTVTVGTPPAPQTVTFDANGGHGSMSNQTASGNNSLTNNTFTFTGYGFAGWNTAADGSGTSYGNGSTYDFSADITLYAQWSVTHTVTFNANGGTGSMDSQTAFGSTRLTSYNFDRVNYSFSGWNTAADGTGTAYPDSSRFDFSSDLTLYAQWDLNVTLTFMPNGGDGSMDPEVTSGTNNLPFNEFSRAGFDFTGWNTAADGSGSPYEDNGRYYFSSDQTLYAQWRSTSSSGSATVTFIDPISTLGVQQTASGSSALTLNSFTRDGYSFAGWTTGSNGSGTRYADGATYSFAANLTLFANWTPVSSNSQGQNSQADADAQAAAEAQARLEAAARAQAAEEARVLAVEAAKSDVIANLSSGKPLAADQLVKAGFVGVTTNNIDLINADIAKLPESEKSNLASVAKVVLKFATVDKVAEGKTIYPNDLVAVGLIPQGSKIKSTITYAIKKLPATSRDTFEKIQAAIAEIEKKAEDRKARIARALARRSGSH